MQTSDPQKGGGTVNVFTEHQRPPSSLILYLQQLCDSFMFVTSKICFQYILLTWFQGHLFFIWNIYFLTGWIGAQFEGIFAARCDGENNTPKPFTCVSDWGLWLRKHFNIWIELLTTLPSLWVQNGIIFKYSSWFKMNSKQNKIQMKISFWIYN